MHRFLEFRQVDGARVALRADGSIWLLADQGRSFEVDRGDGWQRAIRIRLCYDDRIRIESAGFSPSELCASLDKDRAVDWSEGPSKNTLKSVIPGAGSLKPLSAPARVMDNARRNPGTGQVERKETR